jgi:hypothetical protein
VDIVVGVKAHPGLAPEGPVTALLARPDSYTAWATAAARPDSHELSALVEAAQRWFGAPSADG